MAYTNRSFTTSIDVSPTATASASDLFQSGLSLSGAITETIKYSLAGSLAWYPQSGDVMLRGSLSGSFSMIKNLSVSASLGYLQAVPSSPTLSYQIGASYAFSSNASMAASTNLDNSTYISGSIKPFAESDDTLRFNFSGLNFTDPLNHQGGLYYTHNGPVAGMNVSRYLFQFLPVL